MVEEEEAPPRDCNDRGSNGDRGKEMPLVAVEVVLTVVVVVLVLPGTARLVGIAKPSESTTEMPNNSETKSKA